MSKIVTLTFFFLFHLFFNYIIVSYGFNRTNHDIPRWTNIDNFLFLLRIIIILVLLAQVVMFCMFPCKLMIRIYFKINDITTRSTTSNNNNNNIHGNSFKLRCIYRPIYLSIYLIQFALLLPFCNYCIGSIQVENKIVRGIEYFSRVSVRTLLQHKPVVIRIVVVLYFHFWKANPCAAYYHY